MGSEGGNAGAPVKSENIKVAVRLRPFTERERQRNSSRIVDIEQNTVVIYNPKDRDVSLKKFTFDYSYWSHDGFKKDASGVNVPDSSQPNSEKYVGQERVFEDLGKFLLDNALAGYNSALLAYGQTGSGKSYTVSGYGVNEGIVPRFARALFEELDKSKVQSHDSELQSTSARLDGREKEMEEEPETGNKYEVFFSMIEIYNEVVRDLLAKSQVDLMGHSTACRRGLKVREHPKHGFFVENLTSIACESKEAIKQRIEEGHLHKSIAATSMNEMSSRGHTIYEFKIKQYKRQQNGEQLMTTSVVQLVDLAGSERMAVHVTGQQTDERLVGSRSNSPFPKLVGPKSSFNARAPASASSAHSTGAGQQASKRIGQSNGPMSSNHQQRFKESISINQSLSTLGNCIQVLSQYSQQMEQANGGGFRKVGQKIPYRDSMLTKLLNRCCLSGNSKVVIIATLSPADSNYDDTLSTLRFADRAKQIKTHAIVNQMSRSEMVESLQRENERLKEMVNGRVTRSDDSSQTSNFDESENLPDIFNVSARGEAGRQAGIDTMATPIKNRTTIRRSKEDRRTRKTAREGARSKARTSASNPSLASKNQMKRLFSPASRVLQDALEGPERRSNSVDRKQMVGKQYGILNDSLPKDLNAELSEQQSYAETFNDVDLNDLDDINEGLISSESDDSQAALAVEGLTNEEKIGIFNRLLSNSVIDSRTFSQREQSRNKVMRPKKVGRLKAGMRQVSVLSSSLKRSNPYLSNLNQDEQLTGVISYIIKKGTTLVGKSNDCDIVLHGPELRDHHARIIRVVQQESGKSDEKKLDAEPRTWSLFIEPIIDASGQDEQGEPDKRFNLMVNGVPVTQRTKLTHCDRILFGTNAYFVLTDTSNPATSNGNTVADLDLVTYEMAQNEVLKKIMAEEKNKAMLKEISDYTHRPGTGKHKVKSVERESRYSAKDTNSSRLTRSLTTRDSEQDQAKVETPNRLDLESDPRDESSKLDNVISKASEIETKEARYRDQLMEDTYEYALPLAEINAVAKEMDIKVEYSLKILTGEEQLFEHGKSDHGGETGDSDNFSSSLMGDSAENCNNQDSNNQVIKLNGLDLLDVSPALFIKVHLLEHGMDFYWSKEKFQARRFKILELYGPWDVGGKSGLVEHLIEQSRTQGDFLIDPFIDDPRSSNVLVGYAQITLQPISHLTDIKQSYDILDLDDEIVGSINVEVTPCHLDEQTESTNESSGLSYRPFSHQELAESLVENPLDLVGKRLAFLLNISSCQDLPAKYSSVFCKYTISTDGPSVKTRVLRQDSMDSESFANNGGELKFDHKQCVYFENVNQDTLDFLEHGFLTIQVVGQYKLPDNYNKSLTLVSTIINSINKYKYKIEQRSSYNALNYPSSVYCNSNTDSAKSNRGPTSSALNSHSGASSVVSTSATVNLFDQQNDYDEGISSINGVPQENIIDMILTKRKLDRAENQLVSSPAARFLNCGLLNLLQQLSISTT